MSSSDKFFVVQILQIGISPQKSLDVSIRLCIKVNQKSGNKSLWSGLTLSNETTTSWYNAARKVALPKGVTNLIGNAEVIVDLSQGKLSSWKGSISFDLSSKLGQNLQLELVNSKNEKEKLSSSLRLIPSFALVRKRTVYLIRHGESRWNAAQGKFLKFWRVPGFRDAPLSGTGRRQCELLSNNLRVTGLLDVHDNEVLANKVGDDNKVDAATDATTVTDRAADPGGFVILCSPLTRAMQTCVIGLQDYILPGIPLPKNKSTNSSSVSPEDIPKEGEERVKKKVTVIPSCREKRASLFAMDAAGAVIGYDIPDRVLTQLELVYERPNVLMRLTSAAIKGKAKRDSVAVGGNNSSGDKDKDKDQNGQSSEIKKSRFSLFIAADADDETPPVISKFRKIEFNLSEVSNKPWWTLNAGDTKKGMESRRRQLLQQLMWTDDSRAVVVVGHSHFFKDFVKDLLLCPVDEGFTTEGTCSPEELRMNKLCNCGVLKLGLVQEIGGGDGTVGSDGNEGSRTGGKVGTEGEWPSVLLESVELCVNSKLGKGVMTEVEGYGYVVPTQSVSAPAAVAAGTAVGAPASGSAIADSEAGSPGGEKGESGGQEGDGKDLSVVPAATE